MGRPASRAFAAAGAFTMVLFLGGLGSAPVLAQPSDGDGTSQTDSGGGTDSGGTDAPRDTSTDTSSGSSSTSIDTPDTDSSVTVDTEPDEPSRSGGSSREPSEPDTAPLPRESGKVDSGRSLTIPMLRLPAPGEIPAGQLPLPRNFYTTVEIPVPSLTQFLSALSIVPPAPPPGPAFRTQEEAPVVDAATGTAGGGGGGGGVGQDPTVLHAPLVVTVPRAITAASPRAGARAPDAVAAEPGVTAPGVAGASTPTIRGSIAPTPGATAQPMATGASGPRPEAMPRSMVSPTVAQLAAVALPGLAGLILVTFGGGVVGYRQANSLRFVRTAGAERFLA